MEDTSLAWPLIITDEETEAQEREAFIQVTRCCALPFYQATPLCIISLGDGPAWEEGDGAPRQGTGT